ncbi:MAG TPA: CoA transferase subunit A [Candidatus Merdenecus merdavium]|nr:CoA transferase subunit A [Candidatus Merdenecus merdavium]
MKNKIVSSEYALEKIQTRDSVMIGGFMACGTPEMLVDELLKKKVKELIVIGNDSGTPGVGIGKLVKEGVIHKLIVSHIGLNRETGERMSRGEIDVELIPQGTLAEKIRAGGVGLGGILTKTGLGTDVEKGKQIIRIDQEDYLLETPLKAKFALIYGSIVDKFGNVYLNETTRNFNPLMAMAAETVVVEAEKVVDIGEINPNDVMIPGIFIDYIVEGKSHG